MKITSFIVITLSLSLSFLLSSCSKTTEGISKETAFAKIEGSKVLPLSLKSKYVTDVVAKEGSKELTLKRTGTVDAEKVGIYNLIFSATNSEGYEGSFSQSVAVFDPNAKGTNVTGDIHDLKRTSRKGNISLVKGTKNIYYCTDCAFGSVFPFYFSMEGDKVVVISQKFIFGVTSVVMDYDKAKKKFNVEILPQGYKYSFGYDKK